MKHRATRVRLPALLLVIACLSFLGLRFSAEAAPPAVVQNLRQAYVDLAMANHDYKGHRIKAMRQLEAAGKGFGLDLRGDGRNREKQGVSDVQLRAARALLEQTMPQLTGSAHKHVVAAIKQINTALRIR